MTQPRLFLLLSVFLAMALPAPGWAQESTADQAQIVHVLNRITYGPRPGDVEKVQKMGLQAYIQSQLHPESIDDSAVEQVVSRFELLQMSAPQLVDLYRKEVELNLQKKTEEAQREKQKAEGKTPPAGKQPEPMAGEAPAMTEAPAMKITRKDRRALLTEVIDPNKPWKSAAAIGQMEQAKLVRAVDSQRQLQEVLVDFWGNHFNIDVSKKNCRVLKVIDDREVIRPHIWGKFRDLLEASARSPAMLVYLDNATNTKAGGMAATMPEMQPDAMKSMASTADDPAAMTPMKALKAKIKGKGKGGLNENYARELMELHSLGVDGGYTQQDVQEVARCFTGWSVDKLTGEFAFHAMGHDNGAKVVLGHQIPAGGGIKDGEMVLDILVSQPACAKFISHKLCQRFVADNPPASLVDRIAGVFTQSGGDLRQVTEAILTSPEFMAPASYGNKIKSPLEFTVSAVRASDSTLIAQFPFPKNRLIASREGAGVLGRAAIIEKIGKDKKQSLNWRILELGMPLFACSPPTGYKEVSTIWVSPGALIERLNFAMALTQQEILDVQFDAGKILSGIDVDKPEAVLQRCISALLQNNISPPTLKVLQETALPTPGENKTLNPAKLIALMIGSPEFQRK